jgi:glycine oxidase
MASKSKVQTDYLIVGQGLAGSLMALNLIKRGKSVVVIDDGHKHAASKVAAGLINPITGQRHALTWRFMEFWGFLQQDYRNWEELLEASFFYKKPILKLLKTHEERTTFEQKLEAGEFEGIEIDYPHETEKILGCQANEGCYELRQTGYVDQSQFIGQARNYFAARGILELECWKAADFNRETGLVAWKQFEAPRIIFTQGFQNDSNPFFRDLPFRHSKGEIVELTGPGLDNFPVLNRGKWLLSTSPGVYRAGSTYNLKQIDQQVTEDGIAEIIDGVGELVNWKFEVAGGLAGVRPALQDFRPVLGKHPWYPELVIFNGLGSKGSLQAPLLARELVDHLEEGTPLHPDTDIERFRKYL